MAGEARRAEIRRLYRAWRVAIDKTQLQVEALAGIYAGRYWKIENGLVFPTEPERARLALVFGVQESHLPGDDGTDSVDPVQRESLVEGSAK